MEAFGPHDSVKSGGRGARCRVAAHGAICSADAATSLTSRWHCRALSADASSQRTLLYKVLSPTKSTE